MAETMSAFFFLVTMLVSTRTAVSVTQPSPNCTTTCGGVNIPFPFGTSPDCYLQPSFFIFCNETFNPPRPILGSNNTNSTEHQVLDVMLNGQLRVSSPVARNCFDQTGFPIENQTLTADQSLPNNFFFSSTKNKLMGVGCDTVVVGVGTLDVNFTSGCVSLCNSPQDVVNGSCSGFGCCQTSIPKQLRNYGLGMASLDNHKSVWGFDPCSHAFLGEAEAFNFTLADIRSLSDRKSFPVLLDWAVEHNTTCEEARINSPSFACQAKNSDCFNSTNGPGYFCNCSSGYQGNPYLVNGCQDVNECGASINPCDLNAKCENSVGNFSCSCQKGFEGDGLITGIGCSPKNEANKSTLLVIALSITVGLLVLVVAGSWIYWIQRKRKIIKLRENFFHQNGGLLLQQKISQHETSSRDQTTKIFTIEDLKKATNNYSEDRVIGQGGFGTVYKGILPDERVVAIKKSKISDESQTEQFVNEVIILSQINHRNVVKLIGCCLETEVPSLVYEFITNGTLSERIHDEDSAFPLLTWEMRLKIATDTAEALAYLHSAASVPIIHRDIKTANILLDDMYTAKVSDFGASKLVPADQTEIATLVQGTFGYLDPEYFFSNQLTEKSDVYSFGVVLVELLTGERALSYDRPEKHKNLAMHFVCAIKEDILVEILDRKIVGNDSLEQMKGVAKIAQGCLRMTGDERPTREVAIALEGLKKTEKHPWKESNSYPEESELLLDINYNEVVSNGNGYSESAGFNSLKDRMMNRLDGGR